MFEINVIFNVVKFVFLFWIFSIRRNYIYLFPSDFAESGPWILFWCWFINLSLYLSSVYFTFVLKLNRMYSLLIYLIPWLYPSLIICVHLLIATFRYVLHWIFWACNCFYSFCSCWLWDFVIYIFISSFL